MFCGRCSLGAQRFGFVSDMAEDEHYYIATRENFLRALSDDSGVKFVIDDVGALEVGRSLPFAPDSFDLVNCRLALPYMRNARAIAKVARVLRPGGLFLLKIHHARYYLRELWQGLSAGDPLSVVHGARVLAAGTLYHLVRRQLRVRLLNESYQTRWLLRRELAKHGMVIEREQIKTNPLTPAFVIRKAADGLKAPS